MRYFPSASRQRVLVASAAAALTLGGLAIPLANADDGLRDKQKKVERQIEHAHDELGETSKAVQRATRALEGAQSQLVASRARLDSALRQLAEAQERDRAAQARLVAAEEALAQARADVAEGQAALALQRTEVVDTVNNIYQNGDPQLLAFASLMSADTPEDLLRRMEATDAVVGHEDRAYAGLHEAEIALRARESDVRQAKIDIEARRQDAAANLAQVRDLLAETRTARAEVFTHMQTIRDARQQALVARQHDERILAQLKKREDKIKERILAAAARDNARGYRGAVDGLLLAPVSGYVTSPFGYRVHPIYGYYGLHDGTDFGVACGESMRAVGAGTVIESYYSSVYGNRLYLDVGKINGKNVTVVYNHASGYRVGVGERVGRGDTVGYVGSTGWSTGCHLHFTVLENGDPVDPMKYL